MFKLIEEEKFVIVGQLLYQMSHLNMFWFDNNILNILVYFCS